MSAPKYPRIISEKLKETKVKYLDENVYQIIKKILLKQIVFSFHEILRKDNVFFKMPRSFGRTSWFLYYNR